MKIYHALIVSFFVHSWLYMLARLVPIEPGQNSTQAIEVVYKKDRPSTPTKTFHSDYADQEKTLLDKLKDQANRISRITRRVEKEVVARQGETTLNSKYLPQPRLRDQILNDLKNQANHKPKTEVSSIDDDRPSITQPMNQGVASRAQLTDSTISNFIPEVKTGGFTALNSDQFVHYTFYARTGEQIRNRWVNNVRHFLNQTPQTEINRLASKSQSTQLEVILNSKGQFIKAMIHQKSENRMLDESAIAAFRLASPLNNPPEEMIEEDGYIHLHYIFTVYFRPSYIASGSK